jgi:hypothetical protein
MKHPKRLGMSCKNTKFIKRGLTKAEQATVTRTTLADKTRWEYLLSLNAWKPAN